MKQLSLLVATLALASPLVAQNNCITLTNGVQGGAEIAYSPQVVPQSGITLEAWITYDGTTLIPGWAHPTLVRQNISGGLEAYFIRVNAQNSGATRLSWAVRSTSGFVWTNWDFSPGQLLTWTHVAATYDGQMQRLYINGVEMASTPNSGPLRDQGNPLVIGYGDPGSTASHYEVWNGQIDELRLWPFARTAGEIMNTMNAELSTVPGLVSTWNFNNNFQDSSATLHGTTVGTVTFNTNGPTLASVPFPGASPAGAGTPGCLGPIEATVGSLPQPGNADFAFVAHQVPAGAPVAMLFGTQVFTTPFPIAGIDIWIDPTSVPFFIATASVDALGTARLNLPIPGYALPGFIFGAQFVIIDVCGPQGLTASSAIAGGIIP